MTHNIFTLCRSGNHAIIFWIMNNYSTIIDDIPGILYHTSDNDICFINNYNHQTEINISKDELNYNHLLISFEDYLPNNLLNNDFFILRSFHNTLASRYKIWKPKLGIHRQQYIHELQDFIHFWKTLARLAISSKQYIYYDKWLVDKKYRDYIMNKLFNRTNINDNTLFVPNIGIGSSYIGKQRETSVNNYLTRYETTNIPNSWRNLIEKDVEILSLCEMLNS
jgi:hypothetical protein